MAEKRTDMIARKFVEAQTRSEIDEIFKEYCQKYSGHSELDNIARKVKAALDGQIDPSLLTELKSERGNRSRQVHYAEYLLRMRARPLRKQNEDEQNKKRKNDQDEGKEYAPLDFMRLYNFINLLTGQDWRAKTIAVRLFTGRRAGEILYRSNFSEHSEYSVKVTYLSKVPAEQQTLSAIVPTLIPAKDIVQMISEIREEWHIKIEDAWKIYLDTLEEKGRVQAGESIKSRVQNPVVEYFNTQVRPLFPELSQEDDPEKEGAHSLRGAYGCVLHRLMGGHDSQYSEEYMQRALVHVSGDTTSRYRRYRLFNFEPLIADDYHPGIKSMLKLKEIGWMEDSAPIVGFTIDALTGQIADETLAGRILQKIGSNDPDELGRFLGSLIQQGWEAQKSVAAKPEPKTTTVQSTPQKASTESPSAQKIQQIVDAIFLVNEMTGGDPELYPTTPLIQSVYKRLHDKMPNLATCRAVLDQDVNADRIRGLSVANNRHISTDKMNEMIEEVVAQHGQPL